MAVQSFVIWREPSFIRRASCSSNAAMFVKMGMTLAHLA